MASRVIRRPRDGRFAQSFFLRHGCGDSHIGLRGIRTQLLSCRRVQSSAAQPARSYPRRGVFLRDPFADRANVTGRRGPRGCASPLP